MPSPQELWQFIFGSQSDPQQSLDRLRVKLGNLVASPRDTAQWIASLMPAALYGAIRPGAQVDPASSKSAALDRLGQLPVLRQFGAVGDAIAGPGREASGGSVSPGLEMLLSAVPGGFIRSPMGALGKVAPLRLRTAPPMLRRLLDTAKNRILPSERQIFHGTGADFKKFDASEIGSGQGHASYGPGFYFAENPMVARKYFNEMRRDGKFSINMDGRRSTLSPDTLESAIEYSALSVLNDFDAKDLSVNEVLGRAREELSRSKKHLIYGDTEKVLDKLLDWDSMDLRKHTAGSIMTVAIPKEIEPKMLDWDAPLVDQTEEVKRAIKKLEKNTGVEFSPLETGKDAYFKIADHVGADDYVSREEVLSGIEESMDEAGFTGVRYLDRESRRGVGEKATRNYVVLPRIAEEHARIVPVGPTKRIGVMPSTRRQFGND